MPLLSGKQLTSTSQSPSSECSSKPIPLLYSNAPLSFWGGIDPETGTITDHTHPLFQKSIRGTALAIPSSRGSCTGSQVMLEVILNRCSPKLIITCGDVDEVLATGIVAAEELGLSRSGCEGCRIVSLDERDFERIGGSEYVTILPLGKRITDSLEEVAVCHGSLSQVASNQQNFTQRNSSSSVTDQPPKTSDTQNGNTAERILSRLASISSTSSTYIPIKNAHIDSCTYIGRGGLLFIQHLLNENLEVSVPTTLNSLSIDYRHWETLGILPRIAHPAKQLADCYIQLGCNKASFTCAPYLLPKRPKFGKDIAWGESNAVVYANSILGARTNKFPDFMDVCASITGRVPYKGMYVPSNRKWTMIINVTQIMTQIWNLQNKDTVMKEMDALFALLGYAIGAVSQHRIPLIVGMKPIQNFVDDDDWKAFCAAFGTSASAPMFHVARITPEAISVDEEEVNDTVDTVVELTMDHLRQAFDAMDITDNLESEQNTDIDLIAFGNPHLSLEECQKLVQLLPSQQQQKKHNNVQVIATISQSIYNRADQLGYIDPLLKFGIQFIRDTCWCMLTDPIVPKHKEGRRIMTNSGKYAHYAPALVQRRVRFGSRKMCMEAAISGVAERNVPRWIENNVGRRSMSSCANMKMVVKGVACALTRRKTGF